MSRRDQLADQKTRRFLMKKQEEKGLEGYDRKGFAMNEERNCPVCGLKMQRLALHVWQCKCGHKEKGEESDGEDDGGEEPEKRRRFGIEKAGRFREQAQSSHKGLRST